MIRWSRLRRHWLVAILLPMLVLRALVPAGFMAAATGDGGVHMQFCAHVGMHGSHAPDPKQGADPRCPFAQSASPAPLPVLPVTAPGALVIDSDRPVFVARATGSFGPPRQQSPRGPPTLA